MTGLLFKNSFISCRKHTDTFIKKAVEQIKFIILMKLMKAALQYPYIKDIEVLLFPYNITSMHMLEAALECI